jgi:hypothetical protein
MSPLSIKLNNLGISISFGERKPLKKSPEANQRKPRKYYVYSHTDADGSIFYIGKGTKHRAWSSHRHPVWKRYVNERLGGIWKVEILVDNLSEQQADELEAEWISHLGSSLVNWVNPGRDIDHEALERFHTLRRANKLFVAETRGLEKTSPSEAIHRYQTALEKLREYDDIVVERGLIAELTDGFKCGEPEILDRLTLCLIQQGRGAEALEQAERYFSEYPDALRMSIGQRIQKRVQKKSKANTNSNQSRTVKKPLFKRPKEAVLAPRIEAKKADQKRPGYHNGKHFTYYIQDINDLMREGKNDAAEDLLLSLIAATERESKKDDLAPPPYYVHRLAILYSKMKREDLELEILERYENLVKTLPGNKTPSARLVQRLSSLRAQFEEA